MLVTGVPECCEVAWRACRNAFYFVSTYASATIPTKQRPYAFWGLPALAFALHGWQRGKLVDLKYTYRDDICDKVALEKNFRKKFEVLNSVSLTESEFSRLRDEIVTDDVFKASKTLRETGYFRREDGTPLHYTLVNIKDWCKNEFEVINQLRMNTSDSYHCYDVILLINGIPVVQIELKNHQIVTRRAMEQIVNYKKDSGNGYGNTIMCFMQLFIVSNEYNTYCFANNHNEHFSFDADERFLPIYQWADKDNRKITNHTALPKSF